ncbi:MAG: isoprenylcysteine carboxylmethyltransferase family protein [Salinibacter sp.]
MTLSSFYLYGKPDSRLSYHAMQHENMFQWLALAILMGSISISAFHRRRARSQGGVIHRSREGVWLIVGRTLVALPLFGGTVMFIVYPSWMAWASFVVPDWVRWFGVGLGLCTVPSVHWILRTLGRNVSETVLTKDQHELVKSGPYRWIRHPLYTTGVVLFVALGLIAANWLILAFTLLAFVLIRFVVVPREEQELLARFGSEYKRYMRRTGTMLPCFRSER